MRRTKRAAVAAMALFAAILTISPATAEDCQLQRVALLDMVAKDSGPIIIPMAIAGKGALMQIDTGATESWLSETFAASVPGERGSTTWQYGFYFKDAAGEILSQAIKVKSLKLGEVETNQPAHFMIAPDTGSPADGEVSADGLLGNNIIRNFDLEIDPAGRKVGFYLHHDCSEKAPVHWARTWAEIPMKKIDPCKREKDRRECSTWVSPTSDHIIVDVTLDGRTLSAFLDTGADKSLLDTKVAEEILGRKTNAGETASESLVAVSGESVKAYRARFQTLSFSGIAAQNPEFLITKVYDPSAKMIVGLDKLRFLHLFFAFKQNKIYATAAQ